MVSVSAGKRQRRFVRAMVGSFAPWMLSLVLHAGGMVGLGLIVGEPQNASRHHRGPIELELAMSDSSVESYAVAVTIDSRVPALFVPPQALPKPQQPEPAAAPEPAAVLLQATVDPHIAPASYVAPRAAPSAVSPASPTTTQVFGLRASGTRFVYVFDRSASMEGRPLAAAKSQLMASLGDLSPRDKFQIVFYSDQPLLMPAPRRFEGGLLVADDASKRLAIRFVGGILADGPTNHMAALATALDLRPEVIFFLTDADGETLSPEQLWHIQRHNRGTAIHTIEFGSGPPRPFSSFLQRLAMDNGGQHTYIDVTLLR